MSEAKAAAAPASKRASVASLFLALLDDRRDQFGGGVVAYLRNALVTKKKWLDDKAFLELMSISNTLPGLNATNMSIWSATGSAERSERSSAMIGMCCPAFVFMTIAGIIYSERGDRPIVTAMLQGVAAAAVGLIAATWFRSGRSRSRDSPTRFYPRWRCWASTTLSSRCRKCCLGRRSRWHLRQPSAEGRVDAEVGGVERVDQLPALARSILATSRC